MASHSVSFTTIPNSYPLAAALSTVPFGRRAILWCSIAIGCVYLAASWHVSGPAYLRDEIGYLANAAFFAGYRIDAASNFHAGYSLLIAPAFLFSDPRVVWKAVLAINAILWAANFAMLHALLRRLLPHTEPSRLLSATIVSALYPTWLISTGYAFATTAFATVFLASALALFLWSREKPLSILPHSVLTGFLYWVHPTGAAVAAVSILAVALGAWERRDVRPLLLHVAIIAALIVAYQAAVHPWIVASMTPPGYAPDFHYPTLTSALKTLFTWRGFGVFLTMAAGQFAYFIVASFGMALAGLLLCVRQSLGSRSNNAQSALDGNTLSVCLLLGLAPLGVIALGAIAFFHWDRFSGEFWIFGRYLDGAILPLLGIGLAVFRPDFRLALASIFVLAVGLLLAATVPAGVEHDISDTVAFWPQYVSRTAGFFAWMLLGGLAVALAVRFGLRLVIPFMAASLALSIYHQTLWHHWFLTDLSTPSPLVETIRTIVPRGTCVGVNPALPANAALFEKTRYRLHSFYLFDYAYRRMSPAEWLQQCDGPYLTYDVPNLSELGNIRRIASDPASGLLLLQKAEK